MSIEINVTNQVVEINETSEVVQINASGGIGVPSGGLTNQVLAKNSDTNYDFKWTDNATSVLWGQVSGTLSNQTDLQNELNLKVPYTGATGAVSLGLYGLTAGTLTLQEQALNSSTYKLTQRMASNDYWSIYGFASVADYGDLYFELQDNAAFADGQRFRFHYGNASSGTPKDILLMDYNSATIDGALIVNSSASIDGLIFDQTPTLASGVAVMRWNDSDGTLDLGLKGGNVTLQVGQEQVIRVVNKSGAALNEAAYQVVKITDAQGQRLAVDLAQGNNDANSTDTIGIVTETIANNQEGFVTTSGIIRGINTTGSLQGETWVDGDVLYLSPTTAGAITKVKPTAPNHSVILGYVVYAHNNQGKIFVKCDNGYELGELHDVYVPTPSNNDGIFWNTANSRYQNNSIAGILGYTPQAALTLTTTGTSGAATLVGSTLNIPQYSGGGGSMAIGGSITSATAGSVLFAGASGVLAQDNANFFWDDTNNRLGIGTNSPSVPLQLNSSVGGDLFVINGTNSTSFKFNANTNVSSLFITGPTSSGGAYFGATGYTESWFNVVATQATSGNRYWRFGNQGTNNYFAIQKLNDAANAITATPLTIFSSTGNVLLQGTGTSTTDAGYRLDVNGTARFTDNLSFVKNQNADTNITIFNSNDGNQARTYLKLARSGASGDAILAKTSNTYGTYKITTSGDTYLYNSIIGDIGFLNDTTTGKIKFATGGSSTAQMTLTAAGRLLLGTTSESTYILDVNGTARVSGDMLVNTITIGKGNGSFAENTVYGYQALAVTTASFNTAIGYQTLKANTTGFNNTAIGAFSLSQNIIGNNNTAIGISSLYKATGSTNTTLGNRAGLNVTTGQQNTFIGGSAAAGTADITASNNASLGNATFFSLTSGNENVALGSNSLFSLTTGASNSAVGIYSLYNIISGGNNIGIGSRAGIYFGATGTSALTIATGSIYIGNNTRALVNSNSNEIVIGYNAVGEGSNTATLGNTSITKTILRGTINAANLPTSATGLSAGDIWNDAGTLKIV